MIPPTDSKTLTQSGASVWLYGIYKAVTSGQIVDVKCNVSCEEITTLFAR